MFCCLRSKGESLLEPEVQPAEKIGSFEKISSLYSAIFSLNIEYRMLDRVIFPLQEGSILL